jgi:hypothetical protein
MMSKEAVFPILNYHFRINAYVFVLLLFLFLPYYALSQSTNFLSESRHATYSSSQIQFFQPVIDTPTAQLPDTIVVRSKKSTVAAMLLSAVIPGAGQVYTERYWKIPIIWGFGIWLGSQWVQANINYVQAFIDYWTSVEENINNGMGDPDAKFRRDFYRDQRDKYIFYTCVVYILNILDAYVGATLYDFEVTDDLGGSARVQFRIPIR